MITELGATLLNLIQTPFLDMLHQNVHISIN